jgi:hypothetical protein
MLRWLLSLFVCRHSDRYRERRGRFDQPFLICVDCGHAVPAMNRQTRELKAFQKVTPAYARMKARKTAAPESDSKVRRIR